MGFEEHAISSLKNNRRIQNPPGSRYKNKSVPNSKFYEKVIVDPEILERSRKRMATAEQKRKQETLLLLGFTLLLFALVTVLILL